MKRNLRCVWKEIADWPPDRGHGVEFHAKEAPKSDSLIAFLDGYAWTLESTKEVEILIRPASERFPATFLTVARRSIEKLVTRQKLKDSAVSGQIYAWFNG